MSEKLRLSEQPNEGGASEESDMITYSTNWMGPVRKDFYDNYGPNWACGRIDMRGESLGPYGDEVGVPIIDGESWKLLTEWLRTYRTESPDYKVIEMFQKKTGHSITFFSNKTKCE